MHNDHLSIVHRKARMQVPGIPAAMSRYMLCGLALAIITSTGAPAADKEFLVMGNPAAATLYDQYEQLIAGAGKRLPPGTPFEVVARKQLMGDQITPGMRLSYNKNTYYLMLDESGNPSGLPAHAAASFYKGCTVYDDTLTTTSSVTLSLSTVSHQRQTIKKGSLVVRLFTCRKGSYLWYPDALAFGWTSAPSSVFIKQSRPAPTTDIVAFDDLHQRIMKRLALANERYDSVVTFFNNRTGQQRSVPRWDYTPEGKQYGYTLNAPSEVIRQFDRSTGYIINDIERLLLGKPFAVNYRDGKITILNR